MGEDEGPFLYHMVDFSHGIGVSGHSFGGEAAYRHCLYDDEVVCGVNIDGGLFGDYDQEVNHKPFMQIVGENLNVVTRSLMYHDRPVHLLIFKDTKHFGFCDMKLLSRNVKRTGKSDPVKMMDTLNEAHCAFFDRYLKQADTDNRQALDISRDVLTKYEVC